MTATTLRLALLLVASLLLCALPACGRVETAAPSPAPSAVERSAILDALRGAVEEEVGQPVSLAAARVEVGGDWALVRVEVRREDGGEIDWAGIPRFATAYRAGCLSPTSEALLRKRGGAWEVVEVRIGPTDSKRDVWIREHGIPPLTELEE